jgi:hypothetical protein
VIAPSVFSNLYYIILYMHWYHFWLNMDYFIYSIENMMLDK